MKQAHADSMFSFIANSTWADFWKLGALGQHSFYSIYAYICILQSSWLKRDEKKKKFKFIPINEHK